MASTASLILNGHIDTAWLHSRLAGKKDIYCTDGAYNSVKSLNLTIEAIIGDMDSVDSASSAASPLTPKRIVAEDQEYTDFEKALSYLSGSYSAVDVYCAAGNQPDHYLGNLSVGKKYSGRLELMFYDPGMRYFFAKRKETLTKARGKTISVMPFPSASGVTYSGLEYPLRDADLMLGIRMGLRNRAVSDTVEIRHSSGCLIVFVEEENQ